MKGAIANKFSILLLISLILTGCLPRECPIEPKVCFTAYPHQIGSLPHAFAPLKDDEYDTDWGKELRIGNNFAKELDLYRAITAYKRAQLLIPEEKIERRLEIEYNILQSYYLGGKYQDAINTFEAGGLRYIPPSFPPFHDMLVMLYDSYIKIHDCDKAEVMLTLLKQFAPETSEKMQLSEAIQQGNIQAIRELPVNQELHDDAQQFLNGYCCCAKSVKKAQVLNAILPGAGYAYVGQKQSAWTSFALNALFIAASYYFFHEHNYAAGVITASLEMGWYIGGINGAGLEARYYNQALYGALAQQHLQEKKMFPILMFQTTF